ncbi:tetratricopeptide repeat protein [Anthocerotibacter panamensis]|uniref:tetratricopeptide repeat protein n=1 Tax=Anthocerotibacter panamensis TaxID=2857077 RepID=UPI001C402F15|nr:tetratricopeptide repeat protein [Anthocerotibacter panamensis]
MSTRTELYKAIIYECASAMSPEAIERILQEPLEQDNEGFDRYLRAFVAGEIPEAERIVPKKKLPRQATLEKVLSIWETLCLNTRRNNILDQLAEQLVRAPFGTEIGRLIAALDPHETAYTDFDFGRPRRIVEFTTLLRERIPPTTTEPGKFNSLDSLINGCTRGVVGASEIHQAILDWIYEPQGSRISFSLVESPWAVWSRGLSHEVLKNLFAALAKGKLQEYVQVNLALFDAQLWLEFTLVLRYAELTLLQVFEQRVMSGREGDRLAAATYLTFVGIWSELSYALQAQDSFLAEPSYQVSLQVLRSFAQKSYFPLFGPVLVSLSGAALAEVLTLQKVHAVEDSLEMAKIYNLLGCAFRYGGQFAEAVRHLERAVELAQRYGDTATEAACYANWGWTLTDWGRPREALVLAERALVLVRTVGYRPGEAYTLAALGHALEGIHRYSEAIDYLNRALTLARDLEDSLAQALSLLGLGLVYAATERYTEAVDTLAEARSTSVRSRDLAVVGQVCLALANAHKALHNYSLAISEGVQALLVLHRIQSPRWRGAGGLLVVLRGQMGEEQFETTLTQVTDELEQHARTPLLPQIKALMEEFARS